MNDKGNPKWRYDPQIGNELNKNISRQPSNNNKVLIFIYDVIQKQYDFSIIIFFSFLFFEYSFNEILHSPQKCMCSGHYEVQHAILSYCAHAFMLCLWVTSAQACRPLLRAKGGKCQPLRLTSQASKSSYRAFTRSSTLSWV